MWMAVESWLMFAPPYLLANGRQEWSHEFCPHVGDRMRSRGCLENHVTNMSPLAPPFATLFAIGTPVKHKRTPFLQFIGLGIVLVVRLPLRL